MFDARWAEMKVTAIWGGLGGGLGPKGRPSEVQAGHGQLSLSRN